MSALPPKADMCSARAMSALGQKTDIRVAVGHARFTQNSDRESGSSSAEKVPQRIECRIDVIRRMIGADLEADFLVALRHHGVVQTGSEDVVTAQMSYQRRGACSVAQQQRHDRVLAG